MAIPTDHSSTDDNDISLTEALLSTEDVVSEILRWLPVRSRASLALLSRGVYRAYQRRHVGHYKRVAGLVTELRYEKVTLMEKVLAIINGPRDTRPIAPLHDHAIVDEMGGLYNHTAVSDEYGNRVRMRGAPVVSILAPTSYGKSFFGAALSLLWLSQETRESGITYCLGDEVHHPRDRAIMVVPSICVDHVMGEYAKHFPGSVLWDDPVNSPVVFIRDLTRAPTAKSTALEHYGYNLIKPYDGKCLVAQFMSGPCGRNPSWSRRNKVIVIAQQVYSKYSDLHQYYSKREETATETACPHLATHAPAMADQLGISPPGDRYNEAGALMEAWYDRTQCVWGPLYDGCLIIDEAHKHKYAANGFVSNRDGHAPAILLSATSHCNKYMDPLEREKVGESVPITVPSRQVHYITIGTPILEEEVPEREITTYMGSDGWANVVVEALQSHDRICIAVEDTSTALMEYHQHLLTTLFHADFLTGDERVDIHSAHNQASTGEALRRFNAGLAPLPPPPKNKGATYNPTDEPGCRKSILLILTKLVSVGVNIHAQYALLVTHRMGGVIDVIPTVTLSSTGLHQLVGRFVRTTNRANTVKVVLYHGNGWLTDYADLSYSEWHDLRGHHTPDRTQMAARLMWMPGNWGEAEWEVYGHAMEALLMLHLRQGLTARIRDVQQRIKAADNVLGAMKVGGAPSRRGVLRSILPTLRGEQLLIVLGPELTTLTKAIGGKTKCVAAMEGLMDKDVMAEYTLRHKDKVWALVRPK